MRPPHCAGEIDLNETTELFPEPGFNEAPALRGGNRRGHAGAGAAGHASMRPPHCAGEICDAAASPGTVKSLQ